MEAQARLYRITHFGRPVQARPELRETEPPHADMLRYDLAFANPDAVDQVVFPVFNSRGSGRTSSRITVDRWSSFCMEVKPVESEFIAGLDKWFTYEHPHLAGGQIDYFALVRLTLGAFLAQGPLKIAGWR